MEYITSRKNPTIAHMKKLGTDREYRYSCGEYLCQGHKLLIEAIKWKAEIQTVIFSGEIPENIPDTARIIKVTEDIISAVSPMKSKPEVVFSCSIPDAGRPDGSGHVLILENVQDPGNVGTILRTANAFNIDSVWLLGDCSDPYNPKAVRASMGAVFRQKVIQCTYDDVEDLKIPIYGTALMDGAEDIRNVELNLPSAVAMGSEGGGLSQRLLSICRQCIIIPMMPSSESLNVGVAAAIVMWEVFRK